MGQSTFNLSQFFNRLGIKNAKPTMLESIQPVISVGDFGNLVPRNNVATGLYGGTRPSVAGEFAFAQVTSQAPGGSLIYNFHNINQGLYAMDTRETGATVVPPTCQFSTDPMVSIVEQGTTLVRPGGAFAQFPSAPAPTASLFQAGNPPWWLPPGLTLLMFRTTAASPLNTWNLWMADLPASELPA